LLNRTSEGTGTFAAVVVVIVVTGSDFKLFSSFAPPVVFDALETRVLVDRLLTSNPMKSREM
jgi:hypothetical protein